MTCHPIDENAGHWWLTSGKWRCLHAVPGDTITPAEMRDATDQGEPVARRAACGLRRRWWMPGMGSRLGLARCTACCAALGIPGGNGTPANETALAGR